MSNIDKKAFSNVVYGLYVVTCNDGKKDNGMIVNTVMQLTSSPISFSVTINKDNYSHDVIRETNKMNVNCLSVDAPFSLFELYGFKSGRDVNKFEGVNPKRSSNGLVVLSKYVNSFLSLEVMEYIDLGTHGMFICNLVEAEVLSDKATMSYDYYHKNVKPKKTVTNKKGYVCKICGWVYEGDTLPQDIVCPLCKHGASDFEEIKSEEKGEKYMKYSCDLCGWEYDEEVGCPELGIEPGTKFEDLPEDFHCLLCGVGKESFSKVE